MFDDSASALDYKTDARLREELAKNVTDAALVVVAQRIATIMHADQIIVLDDSHVVGTGTHEELLRSCPAYLEIAQSQLSAEELGNKQEDIAANKKKNKRNWQTRPRLRFPCPPASVVPWAAWVACVVAKRPRTLRAP